MPDGRYLFLDLKRNRQQREIWSINQDVIEQRDKDEIYNFLLIYKEYYTKNLQDLLLYVTRNTSGYILYHSFFRFHFFLFSQRVFRVIPSMSASCCSLQVF